MSGSTKLRKIQLGRETVLGTEVDATTVWRGIGVAEDIREKVFPDEHVGYLPGVNRAYEPFQGGAMELESTEATYSQLLHILEMGVDVITPVADGVGTDFISAYPVATTVQPAVNPYTIEAGNNIAEDILTGCIVTDFTLEGAAKEAWKMSGTIAAQQNADGAFTPTIAIPAVQEILFQKTTLAIDEVAGTLGATAQASTLLGATLNVSTGIIPVFTGSGNLYYSHLEYGASEITLDIKLLHNALGDAQKVAWRAGTSKQIRLEALGTAFATQGTAHEFHTMWIDLAGQWEKVNKLGEEDGVDIIEATFRAQYDSTAALYAAITLVHELAAVE